MVESIKSNDYPQGLSQFKTAMKEKYPGKDIDAAIKNCKDRAWTLGAKQNCMNSPGAMLFGHAALALEAAIKAS